MRWRRAPVADASHERNASQTRSIERAFVIATDSAPGSTHNSPAHHSYPINAHHNYPSLAASLPQSTSSAGGGGNASVSTATSSTENRRTGTNAPIRVPANRRRSLPINDPTSQLQTSAVHTQKSAVYKYYRDRVPLPQRKQEVLDIQDKFPGKVMIILERYKKERELPELDRVKFLVPQEITLSQFITIIRNRMNLGRSQAIYFLIDDRSIVGVSTTMAELYAQYHDRQDGFLYMKYASQEVFG